MTIPNRQTDIKKDRIRMQGHQIDRKNERENKSEKAREKKKTPTLCVSLKQSCSLVSPSMGILNVTF